MIGVVRKQFVPALLAAIFTIFVIRSAAAQQAAQDQPEYVDGTDLVLPADYRLWPYVGGGLGMTYADEDGPPETVDRQRFTQVFVNPSSYRSFMETGNWPDGSTFVLEIRRSATDGAIITGGRYATDLLILEAEVKDSRFEDGWAFYLFGTGDDISNVAEPLGEGFAEPCVECHTDHAAVERTFVQFYPELLNVARDKGTLKPGF